MTEFKEGDRVRVTSAREGVVSYVSPRDGAMDVKLPDGSYISTPRDGQPEKLADPEPQWVNGDVVDSGISGNPPLYFDRGDWRWTHSGNASEVVDQEWMSGAWKDGRITVLYKADA